MADAAHRNARRMTIHCGFNAWPMQIKHWRAFSGIYAPRTAPVLVLVPVLVFIELILTRHSREGGNPSFQQVVIAQRNWIPAYAGMTEILD